MNKTRTMGQHCWARGGSESLFTARDQSPTAYFDAVYYSCTLILIIGALPLGYLSTTMTCSKSTNLTIPSEETAKLSGVISVKQNAKLGCCKVVLKANNSNCLAMADRWAQLREGTTQVSVFPQYFETVNSPQLPKNSATAQSFVSAI